MTIIDALNDTVSALANLSKVLAEGSVQTQGVPAIEAASIEAAAPVGKVPKKETKKATKAEKTPEVEITMEMVRGVLAEKSQAGLTDKVKELLNSFGANKLSAVKPEDYIKLMAAARELS